MKQDIEFAVPLFKAGAEWRINSVWHSITVIPDCHRFIVFLPKKSTIGSKNPIMGILEENRTFISSRPGCILCRLDEKEVVYPDCGVPIFVIKDIGVGFRKIEDATEVANLLVRSRAFKVNSKYLNRSYERLNVINEGVVPAVEGCVGYTNEEFERVNKENNDPESEKIGSFNKTVEEANNIRSRVLKYVDKIKQERAYNIDLCMTFERYIEIADKDAERAMAFLKEAYPFNEETEVFIRKRYNMSIGVDPEEN